MDFHLRSKLPTTALAALLLFCFAFVAQCAEIEGVLIPPSQADSQRMRDAYVTLNSGIYTALVRADGHFTFRNVPRGNYILEASLGSWTYDAVRVKITSESSGAEPIITATVMRTDQSLPYPILLQTGYKSTYFVETKSFDYLSLLKNPMVIMLLLTAVFMFAMPKIVGSMSPEELEQFRKSQGSGGLMGMLQGLQQQQEEMVRKPKDGRAASPAASPSGRPE